MIKVRFAPSPTGIPHVGNIRTALFDYFFAKATHGQFILRLEDTDQARKVEGSVQAIKESLEWLGAIWDEYVVQPERLDHYKKYAEGLVEKGFAYEDNGAIRFKVDKSIGDVSWVDAVGNKEISYNTENIEDFIILKADGFPTYHLANVIDDHLMEVTHVIRGEDWIPSTPKHILLYKSFGWEQPVFAHVPNVMGVDGKKLSKRRGAKSVLDFKNEGFLPEALLNYLMLLGWSPKDNREILTKVELEKEFALEKINVSPSIFDEKKLLWMNGEYIRSMQNSDLKAKILEFDNSINDWDQGLVDKLVDPAKSRMKTLGDFKVLAEPFVNKREIKNELKPNLYQKLEKIEDWNLDNLVKSLKEFVTENNISFPKLYEIVIGAKQGLPLGDVFEILGRDKTLSLLN